MYIPYVFCWCGHVLHVYKVCASPPVSGMEGLECENWDVMSMTNPIFGRREFAVADDVNIRNRSESFIGAQIFQVRRLTMLISICYGYSRIVCHLSTYKQCTYIIKCIFVSFYNGWKGRNMLCQKAQKQIVQKEQEQASFLWCYCIILLPFLAVAQHKSNTRQKIYPGQQWSHITNNIQSMQFEC